MTRILVVDDEPQIRKALSVNLGARGYEVDLAGVRRGGAGAGRRRATPTWCCSTSGCPASTASRWSAACAAGATVPIIMLSVRDAEVDKVARPRRRRRRLRVQAVRHGRGARPDARRAAPPPADARAGDRDHRRTSRSTSATSRCAAPTARRRRTSPRRNGRIVEALVRHPGRLVTQRQLLQTVWGPQYERETNYLRVHLAAVRKKLEPEPGRPRYFITEPGIGYRFQPPTPTSDSAELRAASAGPSPGCRRGRATCARPRAPATWPWRSPRRRCGRAGRASGASRGRSRRRRRAPSTRTAAPQNPSTSSSTTGLEMIPSWFQVSTSASSSNVPNPPGSTRKPSASSVRRALRSCIDGVTSMPSEPGVGDLGADQLLGDHPDDLAPAGERGVGDDAHQPDVAAAVDQPEPAVGQRRAELLRQCGERRRAAGVRAAVDAQARRRFAGHRRQTGTAPRRTRSGILQVSAAKLTRR